MKAAHPDFEKKYLSVQNNILRQKKSYPLDYIKCIPLIYHSEYVDNSQAEKFERENFFKNFVMRRIIDIRIQKKKPRLTDIVKLMSKIDKNNHKAKQDFKNRFLALYNDSEKEHR